MVETPRDARTEPLRRHAGMAWPFRLAVCAACLLAAVAIGCPMLQDMSVDEIRAGVAWSSPPTNSRFVDIGGYRICYRLSGSASPTVVMVNGLDENIRGWDKVEYKIARFARVLSYDRGGVGWSERGPDPRSGRNIVVELKTLLTVLQIPPPYVLVAHSAGGMYARLYAHDHPDEVVGMVLIDTTHEDFWRRTALELSPNDVQNMELMMGVVQAITATQGSKGEYYNFVNVSDEVRANRQIRDIPLIVLGRNIDQALDSVNADSRDRIDLIYRQFYQDQATISAKGVWETVPNAGHMIQVDQPDAVVDAVQRVITGW